MDEQNEMNQNHEENQPPETANTPQQPDQTSANDLPKPKSSKPRRVLTVFIIVILIAGIGVRAVVLFSSDDSSESNTATTNQESEQTTNQEQVINNQGYMLDKIFYAHADDAGSPKQIYTRPAGGGERIEKAGKTISSIAVVTQATRNSKKALVYDNKSITLIDVEGFSEQIYTNSSSTRDIVTPIFSSDGTEIVFSEVFNGASQGQEKPVVKVLNVNSGEVTKTIEFGGETPVGVYGKAWDSANQKLFYIQGCYQCDGVNPQILSTTDGQTFSQAMPSFAAPYEFIDNTSVNSSATQIVWVESAVVPLGSGLNLDVANDSEKPAFRIHLSDINSGEDKVIAELGHDLTSQDTLGSSDGSYFVKVGWVETETGQSTPYYTYENKVFQYRENGDDSVLFQGTNGVVSVYWVSDKEIVVGSAVTPNISSGEVVNYLKYDDSFAEPILEITTDTRILGFTFR